MAVEKDNKPVAGRGTPEQFKNIMKSLNNSTQEFIASGQPGRFITYSTHIDNIFATCGWSRAEFYKELGRRLKSLKQY